MDWRCRWRDARQRWGVLPLDSAAWRQVWCGSEGAALRLILSALAFSLMGVCVKQVGSRIPVVEVVLARALLNLAMTWWMLRRLGISPWGQRRGLLAVRGLLGSLALWCVYDALVQLPLASATVLQYLYPSATALLGWLWLREPLGRGVLAGIGLGWLGVLLVARPGGLLPGAPALPAAGVLAAVGGALLTALAYVSVRALGRSEHPLVIVFWFPLLAIPLCLPLVAAQPLLPTGPEALWLLGVGIFTQVGQVFLTQGLTQLPVARSTAIGYSQVLFAALWGGLFFGEQPDGWTALGALLILAAALIRR